MAQSKKNDPLLTLSTQFDEPATVEIDDVEYKIYGQGHMGKEQEINLMTLFKRHERASSAFENANDDRKTKEAATTMRGIRVSIITEFSEIPEEVVEKLPLHAQAQLLDIVAKEMGFGKEPERV